jgi:hypothetical protein
MKASAEATLAIAADPKHLGARIGIIAVLHTWGSALTHHPHVHMIVPGGGLSQDGSRWIASRPDFLVHVKVLSRLFRGRLLAMLAKAHAQGRLRFFGDHAALADRRAFKWFLAPLRKIEWVVYTKEPFAGPPGLGRRQRRRLRWKDYRIDGPGRWKTMTLDPPEFIRRFLIHVLPKGFHRIRHYGLFANGNRAEPCEDWFESLICIKENISQGHADVSNETHPMTYAAVMVYLEADGTPEPRVRLAASLADKFNSMLIGMSALSIASPVMADGLVH